VALGGLCLFATAFQAQPAQAHASPATSLSGGARFSCALLSDSSVRCWGWNGLGQLGYGNKTEVGDNEVPASAGPVKLGTGLKPKTISSGFYHTCALMDDHSVECWGYSLWGELGYGNHKTIGDNEDPASAGPVNLGSGRTAKAVSAGGDHTCAILDDGSVKCWGRNGFGELGYSTTKQIGDDETPASVGTVDLGPGRTATQISVGGFHTCALLDNGKVECWGRNRDGQLGYGNTKDIGDNETPSSAGTVDLGSHRAVQVAAGYSSTCALLDNGKVLCWGEGRAGQLGYGNKKNVGDNETPASVGPLKLGAKAKELSAQGEHTCALLAGGKVRCWGNGHYGELGYGNTKEIGDNETPASVAPVNLHAPKGAVAVVTGGRHTCAALKQGGVRCWGLNSDGQLGYGNTKNIGDNETPGSVGPVKLGGKIATN
jgi:alpha-tubulin suppressor-like RCC1 family protein